MPALYDTVSFEIAKRITRRYSTSFSIGIHMLHRSLHHPIYGIYGFVRVADEIVDTFLNHDQESMINDFETATFRAIEEGISTNPVLHAFQKTVNSYEIDHELIRTFLASMRMDLDKKTYNPRDFQQYILGSAEVVGLMCLKVFVNGNQNQYDTLKEPAMKLGSAFQKVNFLRDLASDFHNLGRSYFPSLDLREFNNYHKKEIEESIEDDFSQALDGIRALPKTARFGVYTAYIYYLHLFKKIKRTSAKEIMSHRVRISNKRKLFLLMTSFLKHNLKTI